MAVTQYIGARYVPKFYENSDNTSDWRSGVIYEPLTIVTYNGNSYTSKKPVPANIGNPSANPTYWAPTGIYNQQVEALRQEFEQLKTDTAEDIEEVSGNLYNKINKTGFEKAILISDSYGVDGISGTKSWITLMQETYGDRIGAVGRFGGAGFGWSSSEGGFFPNHITTMPDDTAADVVILLAGANDGNLIYLGQATRQNIWTGIHSTLNMLKVKYPNARIKIGFVGRYKDPARFAAYKEARDVYRDFATYYGYEYIENSEYTLHALNLLDNADIHPSTQGSIELMRVGKAAIEDIPYHVHWRWPSGTNVVVEINDEVTTYTFTAPTNNYFGIAVNATSIRPLLDIVPVQSDFGHLETVFNPVGHLEGTEICQITNQQSQSFTAALTWLGDNTGHLNFQAAWLNGSAVAFDNPNRLLFGKYLTLKSNSMLC